MAIRPALPEEYDAAQKLLRAEIRVPRAEARNVAIAASPDADSYFRFRGVLYKAPPLSYEVGIQLQEIHMQIENLSKLEKSLVDLDALPHEEKIRHLQLLQHCYERAAEFFQRACFPVSFWRRRKHKRKNPFTTCTSQEVGELLGFFSMCRMKSRVSIMGSLANRPSLSTMLTQPTT